MTMTKKKPTKRKRKPAATAPSQADRAEHRALMRGCLMGGTPSQIRSRLKRKIPGITTARIQAALDELMRAGVRAETRLLTVNQAAVALGVIPRRVRLLCQDGRIGAQIGAGPWIIERGELVDFMGRDHKSGQAGRKLAEADKAKNDEHYGGIL